jgi:plastocyanin
VALAALLLGSTAAPAAAAEYDITIGPGNQYATRALTVAPGDLVRWQASSGHPLRFDGESGQYTMQHARTLGAPGRLAFYCATHGGPGGEGMSGVITVQAPGNAPPAISLARETASPAASEPVAFRATASDPEGQPVRIDWDLDGDGTFELIDAGPAVSSRYAAGGHTVTARAVDPGGASGQASLGFTVGAAPGPGGGAPGGGEPGIAGDTAAPTVRVRVARKMALRTLRRRGVRVRLTPSEDGRLAATLRDAAGRRLGRAAAPARAGERTTLRMRAPRAKPGSVELRVTVTDRAGNRRTVSRTLRVRNRSR